MKLPTVLLLLLLAVPARALPPTIKPYPIAPDFTQTPVFGIDATTDSIGGVWFYDASRGRLVSPGPTVFFLHSGSFTGGAYGIFSASAVAVDSTLASGRFGYMYPESLLIGTIRWWNRLAGAGVNDSNQVFVNSSLVWQAPWVGDQGIAHRVDLWLAPGQTLEAYDKPKASGAVHPFNPVIECTTWRVRSLP